MNMSEDNRSKRTKLNDGRAQNQAMSEKNEGESVEVPDVTDKRSCSKSTNVSETNSKPFENSDIEVTGNKKELISQKYNSIMTNRLPLMKDFINMKSISTGLISSYAVMLYEMSIAENMTFTNVVQ